MKILSLSCLVLVLVGCRHTPDSQSNSAPATAPKPDASIEAAAETFSSILPASAEFKPVQEGVDYETGVPYPLFLQRKKILLVATAGPAPLEKRIIVGEKAVLEAPKAGIDFPTDTPPWPKGTQILVLGKHRFPIILERAPVSAEEPTDTIAHASTLPVHWIFAKRKIRLDTIREIEKARPRLDYSIQQKTPPSGNFYIARTQADGENQKRIRLP